MSQHEPRDEEIPDVLESQNDTNMMEILKDTHSQMINLTKDVVSIKNQLNDHIQNCSSENGRLLKTTKKTIKNMQTQLETVINDQWNRFQNPRRWGVYEYILIFLVFNTFFRVWGALITTICLVAYYKGGWSVFSILWWYVWFFFVLGLILESTKKTP